MIIVKKYHVLCALYVSTCLYVCVKVRNVCRKMTLGFDPSLSTFREMHRATALQRTASPTRLNVCAKNEPTNLK